MEEFNEEELEGNEDLDLDESLELDDADIDTETEEGDSDDDDGEEKEAAAFNQKNETAEKSSHKKYKKHSLKYDSIFKRKIFFRLFYPLK